MYAFYNSTIYFPAAATDAISPTFTSFINSAILYRVCKSPVLFFLLAVMTERWYNIHAVHNSPTKASKVDDFTENFRYGEE